tara:strand:+ start:546 stop:1172 length:627 start_codon:yes stop_codon:yes gene_type:complete
MKKTSAATSSNNQVDTWGAGMHPDYIGTTSYASDARTHGAFYKWGDSSQSKEFMEPGEGFECDRITDMWIETSGKWHYLVTQMESDGDVFNFKVDYPRKGDATPKLYHYLLNLAGLYDVNESYEQKFEISAGGTRGACFINFKVPMDNGGWRRVNEQVFDDVMSDINGVIGLIQQRLGVTPSFEPIDLGKPVADFVSKRKNNKLVPAS